MHSKSIYIIFSIVGVFWVGGWGFLMFRYPKFFADFNARFGFKMFSSPKYGGNYRGSGWQMMGFADQHAFTPPFGYYDREYTGFVPYGSSTKEAS